MRLSTLAALAAAPLFVAVARAQTPARPATVVSATQLRALSDSLGKGPGRTFQLGAGAGMTWAVTGRDTVGGAEVHMAWTDIFVVQTGTATLLTGGFTV